MLTLLDNSFSSLLAKTFYVPTFFGQNFIFKTQRVLLKLKRTITTFDVT